jgi:hypothetical protein
MQIGIIESHKTLLRQPHDSQLLYKVMSVENLIRSISGSYLYFNRIDSYKDFPHDGKQLPKDWQANNSAKFDNHPDLSAANYYNKVRSETYASCFSLEDSKHIWKVYGNEGQKGKICLVFNFGKLRTLLNNTLNNETSYLECNGIRIKKIFSI